MSRRLLLLVSAVVLVDTTFYAAITPLLPYYSHRLELSKGGAGLLVAAYPAGTLAGSLPAGWLAGRIGVRRTLLVGLALLGGSSLLFGFGTDAAVLDVARFAQGVGGAASWAAGLAWLVAAATPARRGETIGTAFGAAVGGALLGPVLGALARAAGPRLDSDHARRADARRRDSGGDPLAPLGVGGRAARRAQRRRSRRSLDPGDDAAVARR